MIETDNFTHVEMACPCCDNAPMDREFMRKMELWRRACGRIDINSGYRCKKHNAEIRPAGATNSKHLHGMAADGVPHEVSIQYASEAAKVFFKGVIIHDTFIHVDDRDEPYFKDERNV